MSLAKQKNNIKFLILVAAIILLWNLGNYFHVDSESIQKSLKQFPVYYSGAIFIILYVIVTFFIWLSKDIFRLTAAILFGAYQSTLFIWIAEVINAFVLFFFSRFLGRSFVENSFKKKYPNLDKRLAELNLFWLFIFRAVPLVPFRFLDLAVGLTNISLKRYVIAVVLGSPLRIFWVQYVLAGVGKNVLSNPYLLVEYFSSNKIVFILSLVYLILVILVALKVKIKR